MFLYLIFYLFAFILRFQFSISACTPSPQQCGCSVVKPVFYEPKIVGGITARNNSWPWMVSFRRVTPISLPTSAGSAFCGGVLISDRHVLTAAHCFEDVPRIRFPLYFAVVGAIFRNDINAVRHTVQSVIIHPGYRTENSLNDIAVVRLNPPVRVNTTSVRFICSPSKGDSDYPREGMNGTVIGWGRLEEGGQSSRTLQQVELPIVATTNPLCANLINNPSTQFCAGVLEGGKDSCQGDSGGPLMVYNSTDDTWNIAGIVSYGEGCALPQKPGVYTRVVAYIDWINSTLASSSTVLHSNTVLLFILFINLLLE